MLRMIAHGLVLEQASARLSRIEPRLTRWAEYPPGCYGREIGDALGAQVRACVEILRDADRSVVAWLVALERLGWVEAQIDEFDRKFRASLAGVLGSMGLDDAAAAVREANDE